jgi:hypothetical protein
LWRIADLENRLRISAMENSEDISAPFEAGKIFEFMFLWNRR